MAQLRFENFDSRLPTNIWKKIATPTGMTPLGATFETTIGGNPAFGFFDNFQSFQASTLEGPYLILEGSGCSIEQIASTATEKGLVQLAIDGNAANDEVILQHGRGLDAPFKLADRDLVFEARFAVSAITAAKWSIGVGLGEVGMGATDEFFVDTSGALADNNFLGFVKLKDEGADWDGVYKADGQTYQDGSTKTKLDALLTAVANTYYRVGFRYNAHPKTVEWWVEETLPGGLSAPARLTAGEIDAATFPNDVLLAPIFGAKDIAGNAALNIKLDWWGCVQLL